MILRTIAHWDCTECQWHILLHWHYAVDQPESYGETLLYCQSHHNHDEVCTSTMTRRHECRAGSKFRPCLDGRVGVAYSEGSTNPSPTLRELGGPANRAPGAHFDLRRPVISHSDNKTKNAPESVIFPNRQFDTVNLTLPYLTIVTDSSNSSRSSNIQNQNGEIPQSINNSKKPERTMHACMYKQRRRRGFQQ